MRLHSDAALSLALLVAAASLSTRVEIEAFTPAPPSASFACRHSAAVVPNAVLGVDKSGRSVGTALHGVKRGRLVSNVSPDGPDSVSTTGSGGKKRKKGSRQNNIKSGKKKSAETNAALAAAAARASAAGGGKAGGGISSSLADWAASSDDGDAAATATSAPQKDSGAVVTEIAPAAAAFEVFREEAPLAPAPEKRGKKSSSSSRRSRQAERTAAETDRRSVVASALTELKDLLDPPEDEEGNKPKAKTSFDVSFVLDKIRTLRENPPDAGASRSLVSGSGKADFRLAWAGSDDAVCSLCSGLHNVPLARLQEVFITLGKGGKVEVLEVIRILGPFPNVRNTLKGDAALVVGKGADGTAKLNIAYGSMIDGTGKVIPAPSGAADGIRRAELDVLYADDSVVACSMPAEDGQEEEPLTGDGSRVLLFFREDDLDGQLNKNRVS